jgi:hypothetical protein
MMIPSASAVMPTEAPQPVTLAERAILRIVYSNGSNLFSLRA